MSTAADEARAVRSGEELDVAAVDAWLKRGIERRKERMLGHLDQNKDGSVTRDEVDAYIDALFNGADGDKDGSLTLAEIRENSQKRSRQRDAKSN